MYITYYVALIFSSKSYLHKMRSITNFTRNIYKTNMRSSHISDVSMRLLNELFNDVKVMSFVPFTV